MGFSLDELMKEINDSFSVKLVNGNLKILLENRKDLVRRGGAPKFVYTTDMLEVEIQTEHFSLRKHLYIICTENREVCFDCDLADKTA